MAKRRFRQPGGPGRVDAVIPHHHGVLGPHMYMTRVKTTHPKGIGRRGSALTKEIHFNLEGGAGWTPTGKRQWARKQGSG